MRPPVLALAAFLVPSPAAVAQQRDYPHRPVPFTKVHVRSGFWKGRLDTNRAVTVPYTLAKCEETGRIRNLAIAGGLEEGGYQGLRFNDSDVFKVVEGAAYSLATDPDPELARSLEDVVAKIAAAQEDDGYLFTLRTIDPELAAERIGARWSRLAHSHELYNVGHLYEAAVAHWMATGRRTLLEVAIENAELIAATFRPDGRRDPPGHQEIEIGLVKLYRATGEERYLELAKFFLDERGNADGHALYGRYSQDHAPVTEQDEAVGHAVRAGYMYSGMADVAALTGDRGYLRALDRIWEDVLSRKIYVTGGIGASRGGEAFGEPFELPNASAYNETCAAIALALWAHRMFLLHGDGRYADVLEWVVHNGFLAGVSLEGDRFFYPNPLACDGVSRFNQGSLGRSPWFDCSCCPVNVVRFVPSVPGLVYAVRGDAVFVNLYADSEAEVTVGDRAVALRQATRYPWSGEVAITVSPDRDTELELCLRIPGWTGDAPLPGGPYRYLDAAGARPRLAVNGRDVAVEPRGGYARIRRTWRKGDRVDLRLPMPVRRIVADDRVAADRGRVAVARGPIVYCAEAIDHGGRVRDLALADDAALRAEPRPDLLGGVQVVSGPAQRVVRTADGVATEPATLTAVPYHVWAHRDVGEMQVWIARRPDAARPAPLPTIASRAKASASHVWRGDSVRALNDQVEPRSSIDHEVPRFTWWDHRGGREWVQYEFERTERVREVAVYWFDDRGRGACRVPESWRVLYRDGDAWRPVDARDDYGVARDRFNRVRFDAVATEALRLDVGLREGWSGGILEWRVR